MEGVAIYINKNNFSTIIAYKEYSKNCIFFATFFNKKLYYQFITYRQLSEIIPKNCIHIMNFLPFNRDIYIMLDLWKIQIKSKLNILLNQGFNHGFNEGFNEGLVYYSGYIYINY